MSFPLDVLLGRSSLKTDSILNSFSSDSWLIGGLDNFFLLAVAGWFWLFGLLMLSEVIFFKFLLSVLHYNWYKDAKYIVIQRIVTTSEGHHSGHHSLKSLVLWWTSMLHLKQCNVKCGWWLLNIYLIHAC